MSITFLNACKKSLCLSKGFFLVLVFGLVMKRERSGVAMKISSEMWEEWEDKYCRDNNMEILTQEDFDKLIEKDTDNDLRYTIKIDHAILKGTYELNLTLTHSHCDIYVSNSKLYMFNLTEIYCFSKKLIFNNCDVYCIHFRDALYGTYNNCTIHAMDPDDQLTLFAYNSSYFLNCIFDPMPRFACPEEGSFIGWKLVQETKEGRYEVIPRILKIRIPTDAKRSSAFSNKCRCSKAVPLEVYDLQGNVVKPKGKLYSFCLSLFNIRATPLEYIIGKEVYSDKWDEDRFNECSNGIHFFMKMEEAQRYYSDIKNVSLW